MANIAWEEMWPMHFTLLCKIVKRLLYIVSIDLISSFLVGPEYGLQQIKLISSHKKNPKTENKINSY